ncbi:hypothetical protein [Chitinophaga pinensis]|uniref:Uncharacterized protein n=1 Tax=Chitinophaga pinensis TaxID=79329 RepID=A0A5C6LSP1_9BACT|nr:hypothetical protein [Chitinophaga pinensis]TWV98778.1 hypothetical protein FEF09_20355 [Chitinophaga pinensis]
MQTTALLTDRDIKILKDLRQPDGVSVIAAMVMGIALLIVGIFICAISISEDFLRILGSIVLLLGGGITFSGLRLRWKTNAYFANPPHGNIKQVVTDQLLRVEVLNKKLLRYHFNGYQLDLYIASGIGHHPANFRHKRPIDEVKTLQRTPVRLSYVEYTPEEKVLLDITYTQYNNYAETVLPITEEDRKKSLRGNVNAAGCILGMAVFLSIVLGFITHFDSKTFPLILFFGVGPMVAIGFGVTSYMSWKIKKATDKIAIRTTITEVVVFWIRSGRSSSKDNFYRLGDGSLVHITNTPFQPGDNVLIQFLRNKNGTRGFAIEMVKI